MTTTTMTSRPRWMRLAGWQTAGHGIVFAIFLAVAVAVVTVVLAIVSRSVTPTMSGFQFAQQVALWLPFAVAIHFAVNWLGPHVSAGMTRRSFVRAAVTAVLAIAASGAVILLLALRIEGWIYDRLGWSADYDAGRASPVDSSVLPYWWSLFLALGVWGLTGLVVGLTYFRLGSAATLLLPLTLAPLAVVSFLALDPSTMFVPFLIRFDGRTYTPPDLGLGGIPASIVIGSVLLVVLAAAVHLLARRVPVRSPRA